MINNLGHKNCFSEIIFSKTIYLIQHLTPPQKKCRMATMYEANLLSVGTADGGI